MNGIGASKVVLGVAIGVALGYAVLGFVALIRRFLPSRSKVPQSPQASVSASISREEIARIDERFRQQQRSIDVAREGLGQSIQEMTKRLAAVEEFAQLGRVAYQAIYAMLMLRVVRHPLARVARYAEALRALPANLDGGQLDYYSNQLMNIRMNLEGIVDHLRNNAVDGASDLKAELSRLSIERKKQRTFEESSSMPEDERYGRERDSLLREAETIHSAVQSIKTRYMQICRAPRTKEVGQW